MSNPARTFNRITLEDLTTRLHDILMSQPEMSSLNHVKSLLMQTLGGTNWEEATETWDAMEVRSIAEGVLQENTTLVGDWRLLVRAIDLLEDDPVRHSQNYESYEAVQALCQWWNENAPEGSRQAGCFYIHELDENEGTLSILGYEECPPSDIEDFVTTGNYALFEIPGRRPLAITFLRGKRFNRYVDLSTQVYTASGEVYSEIGTALEDVDEAFYSVSGLMRLSKEGKMFRRLMATHQAEEIARKTPSAALSNTVSPRL